MHRLQDQNAELQHWIEGRPAALRAVPRPQRCHELGPEDLEVHGRGELLERIALCGEVPQPFLDVPEP